jgi:hypothetical protein
MGAQRFREALLTQKFNLFRNRRILVRLQLKAGRLVSVALAGISMFLVSAVSGSATGVSDPSNDFLPTFAGPHNGDLDVVAANITLDGSNFDFTATMNDVLALTPGAVYVFGMRRYAE